MSKKAITGSYKGCRTVSENGVIGAPGFTAKMQGRLFQVRHAGKRRKRK